MFLSFFNSKGYGTIEILLVTAIIGMLSGIAVPQYQQIIDFADQTVQAYNIKIVESAVIRYQIINGKYPETLEQLVPDYLREVPVSPLSREKLDYEIVGSDFIVEYKKDHRTWARLGKYIPSNWP